MQEQEATLENPNATPENANTKDQQGQSVAQEFKSPFEEIKEMNDVKAVNILIQAANAAQKAGALSINDSVLVAKAAEHIGSKFNEPQV
jgi:predicted nucleic acid-binding protein